MNGELEKVFASGRSFEDHQARMRVHRTAFGAQYEALAFVPAEERGRSPFDNRRILALTEDYCVDSVLNLPLVGRLAEASPACDLRIASRDEHPGLAARFPGRAGMSRLPTVIFFDESGKVRGYWSERSRPDQVWMERFSEQDPIPALSIEDGVPAPELAAWMDRRIAAQAPGYLARGWRAARDELVQACLGA